MRILSIITTTLLAAAGLARANTTVAQEHPPAPVSSAETSTKPVGERPNFIVIFTDDQGYGDLGVFGSPNIKTPNIDRMAKEGRIFTSFYVASPVCTASRAALMTGCYPARVGITKPVFFPDDNCGLHPEETTIADMLKTAGYATACVGKWHLGHLEPFLPTNQGFDSYYGIPYSNDMSAPDNKRPRAMSIEEAWRNQEAGTRTWNAPLMENGKIIEIPVDQRTITRRYTDKAIEFVTKNKDKPFFLYLAHNMPHIPLFVPEDSHDPDPENAYKCAVEHIDTETGRLMDALREQGLHKNTYVIFTSDNGPWLTKGSFGGSAGPFSGGKGTFHEGGIRVPCVMWGPGRIPAGTRTDGMASTIDLLPTFAALAGVNPETRGPIDGLDISGLMTGQAPSPRTEFLFCGAERQKSGNFKGLAQGMRQGDWKILGKHLEKDAKLYNLANDPAEKQNLAQKNPQTLAALRQRAGALWREICENRRTLGQARP